MKSNWLRGVLLGVSLALLLAGGMAMAAGVYVTVDKPCVECVKGVPAGSLFLPEENLIDIEFGGWDIGDYVCIRWMIDSSELLSGCGVLTSLDPITYTDQYFPCGTFTTVTDLSFLGDASM